MSMDMKAKLDAIVGGIEVGSEDLREVLAKIAKAPHNKPPCTAGELLEVQQTLYRVVRDIMDDAVKLNVVIRTMETEQKIRSLGGREK